MDKNISNKIDKAWLNLIKKDYMFKFVKGTTEIVFTNDIPRIDFINNKILMNIDYIKVISTSRLTHTIYHMIMNYCHNH